MSVSRKDFRMVAQMISETRDLTNYYEELMEDDYDDYMAINTALDYLAYRLAQGFKQSNSRFNTEKFVEAADETKPTELYLVK